MNKTDFRAQDEDVYEIWIDDSGEEISVFKDESKLGSISLNVIHDDMSSLELYHITHLALDKCKRRGIGRACLIYHRELFGMPISAGSDTGTRSDDGSHLTGDGLPFVTRMREEGLIISDAEQEEWEY